jgi:N-dimethylarginine dimethylaminohydrolase
MSILLGTPYIYNKNYCSNKSNVSTNKKEDILSQLEKVFHKLGIQTQQIEYNKDKYTDICAALWVRDMFVKIDDIYVLLPGTKNDGGIIRENEYKTIENLFKKKLINYDEKSKIEGGDIIQHKNTIFVGLNRRTNLKGLSFLKKHFNHKTFIQISHKALHLDCCFCILHNNIVLYSKKYISNLPSYITSNYLCLDLETILGEKIDVCNLAANFVIVNKDIITAYKRSFKPLYNFLELAGYKIHYVTFHRLQKSGGGVRCLTQWIQYPKSQDFF